MPDYSDELVTVARELIPRKVRLTIYLLLLAAASVVIGISQWHSGMHTEPPAWIAGAYALMPYALGIASGLAAVNATDKVLHAVTTPPAAAVEVLTVAGPEVVDDEPVDVPNEGQDDA